MEDFVAHTSRWRTGLMFLASLAFICIGLWMIGLFGPPPVSRYRSPMMIWIWGWISIVFFGLCAVVIARIWWRNEERLRIGNAGIRWLPWCDQFISWGEIADVRVWNFRGTRSIILHLRNPSLFPGTGITGMAGRANRVLTGGDIGITLSGTNRSFDEAMTAIENFRPPN